MALMALGLGLTKSQWGEKLGEEAEKLKKNREHLDKFTKEFDKLDKFNLNLFLNRVIYYPTTLIVFVGLGDTLLGITMLTGCILGYIVLNQFKALAKELKNALS